jgi:hypothetical protein
MLQFAQMMVTESADGIKWCCKAKPPSLWRIQVALQPPHALADACVSLLPHDDGIAF